MNSDNRDDRDDRARAVVHAAAAAEAVRELNHATRPAAGGYQHPMDLTITLGELATLAQRLPQALTQAAGWLERETHAGRVGHERGAKVPAVIAQAEGVLFDAADSCEHLAHLLRAACGHTAHLTRLDGGRAPR
jgi:hypothetical protein